MEAVERPTERQIASWYPRLFRTALRMVGDIEDAADLTQQAFCKALGNWEQFDGKALPTTWLHSILVNCVRDWSRRQAVRDRGELGPWALNAVPDTQREAAGHLADKERLALLRLEIEALPEEIRQAFIAVVIDGCTYQEAGELLSVPAGTIGSRIGEARRRVYRAMRTRFPEV